MPNRPSALRLFAATTLLAAGCASTGGSPDAGAADQGAAATKMESAEAKRVERAEGQGRTYDDSLPQGGVVVDVLKGDELVLEDGWVVRLVGIDVPTADYGKRTGEFYGKAAIDFVKEQVLNKKVELSFDSMPKDVYDRYLAYVKLPSGEQLNELLVAKGYALSSCFPPNTKYCGVYAARQHQAVQGRKGLWDFDPADWPKAGPTGDVLENVKVARVTDGDTIQLEDGTVVRYIGIDAPESETSWKPGTFGYEAYALNRELVEGKTVDLEYDTEFSDPRGRELAYVYVNLNGQRVMANAELVRRGVAWVAVFPPNIERVRELFEAQEKAVGEKVGIWGK